MDKLTRAIEWLERRINLTEIFSLLGIFGVFYTEVDTSKPLRPALREALKRPMPAYARWPRVLGILVLLTFAFQVATGLLLALYYQPGPEAAYQSVLTIVRDTSFGWFFRELHRWGGQLLVILLLVRLIRFFFGGLYRPPRELIWLAGVGLLAVGAALDFSGRLLFWSNDAYWAAVRILEMLFSLPLIGFLVSGFLGGTAPEGYLLSRMYVLHILVLPLFFFMGLYLNFSSVRRVGLTGTDGEGRRAGLAPYLAHCVNLAILLLLLFGVLVTLAVLWPARFGEPVNPFLTPSQIGIPWYTLALYGFVEVLPGWLPLWARSGLLAGLLVILAAIPVLELRFGGPGTRRKAAAVLGWTLVVCWIWLTYYGWALDRG